MNRRADSDNVPHFSHLAKEAVDNIRSVLLLRLFSNIDNNKKYTNIIKMSRAILKPNRILDVISA